MASPQDPQKDRYFEPQARGQLLWTGLVAFVIGALAIQQTTDPSYRGMTPEVLNTGNPLSSAAMVHQGEDDFTASAPKVPFAAIPQLVPLGPTPPVRAPGSTHSARGHGQRSNRRSAQHD